jgi:NO-binding membrane sensor protein with MHYT domain
MQIHHFSFGALTPTLAYVMSCAGSLLGLLCTTRAQVLTGRARIQWLMAGALAIGGTGIWVMHFIAMLGFSVTSVIIRYDVVLTLLSALIAIVFVGIGLYIAGARRVSNARLALSGLITGVGVAAMHYTGMTAMQMNAEISYNPVVVALSVLIAVGAATAALWAALNLRSTWATMGASLIMGVAVSAMHYTGMLSVSVQGAAAGNVPSGAEPLEFLVPIIIGLSLSTICLLTALAAAPTRWEIQREAELMTQLGGQHNGGRPIWLDTSDPPRPRSVEVGAGHDRYHGPVGAPGPDGHSGPDGNGAYYAPDGHAAQYWPGGHAAQYGPDGHAAQYGPDGHAAHYRPDGHAAQYGPDGHAAHYRPDRHAAQYGPDGRSARHEPDGSGGRYGIGPNAPGDRGQAGPYRAPTNQ